MTEHGTYAYDAATRTIRGLLIPFGEPTVAGDARQDVYTAETLHVPADPDIVTLNRQHNRFDPIGRATVLEKQKGGVYSEYRVARTPEGDAWLAEHVDEYGKLRPSGKLSKLSAEVTDIVREAGRIVSARLTGAALVTQSAFASAALYELTTTETHDDTYTDADGVTWRRVEDIERTTTDDGTTTTTATVVESVSTDPAPTTDTNPDAAEAEDTDPDEEYSMTLSPTGAAPTEGPRRSLSGMYAAIAASSSDRSVLEPYREAGELFALATLPDSGPAAQTIGADTSVPEYLGELWSRAPYARRFIPLVSDKPLTSDQVRGWRWTTEPDVGDYAGNAAEVPSNGPLDTEPVTAAAARLAGGHRLDRKFRDFNQTEVIASYIEHQTDNYKRKSDAKCLAAILAAAQTTAPGSVPSGIAKGLAAIVDGALGVIATENRPAFAILATDLWRDIALMKDNDKLAFLNAGFGLTEGDVDSFKIVPGNITAGMAIVGAKEALTYFELPGEAPIRVDGLVPGNGAEDIAAFGYWATLVNNANAIRKVQTV